MAASGIIPMFLSTQGGGSANLFPDKTGRLRQILLACGGSSPELAGIAEHLACGFNRKNAGTTILNLSGPGGRKAEPDIGGYDGVFIGIATEETGAAEQGISFMRDHMETLTAKPVTLFLLLPGPPGLAQEQQEPCQSGAGVSGITFLDVMRFTRSGRDLKEAVMNWAGDKVWPLMETAWLADMIFPGPDPAVNASVPAPG